MWVLFAVLMLQAVAEDGKPGLVALENLGRFDEKQLPEASGIVKSRRHPGTYWVHNDSGNAPVLFAVRRDGTVIRRFRLAIPNLDWEDIAIDEAGHLYLGDIGNNAGFLRVRTIYRLDEPDPSSPEDPARDRPLEATRTVAYALPPGNRFDAEGLFLDRGTAILVAKYHDGREAALFAVPMDVQPTPAGAPGAKPASQPPRELGRLPGFTEPATGADLSQDGTLLAVCSYGVTRVFRRGNGDAWEPLAEIRYKPRPIEGITWDGRDLILAAENADGLWLLREAAWRAARVGGTQQEAGRPGRAAPAARSPRVSP
jgi:hypothetical protein